MGCALRCEGDLQPTMHLRTLAKRCERIAQRQGQRENNNSDCDPVTKLYDHKRNLASLKAELASKQKLLLQKEQQLEEAMKGIRKKIELSNISDRVNKICKGRLTKRTGKGGTGGMLMTSGVGATKRTGGVGEGSQSGGGEEAATITVGERSWSGGGEEAATITVGEGSQSGGGEEAATITVGEGSQSGGGEETATITVGEGSQSGGGEEAATITVGEGSQSGGGEEAATRRGEGSDHRAEESKSNTNLLHDFNESSMKVKHQLFVCTNQACTIESEIMQLKEGIEVTQKEVVDKEMSTQTEEDMLLEKTLNLEAELLNKAYMEQKRCKQVLEKQSDEDTKKSLLESLRQCGTSLIGALVIGFDMESEGIPSALSRVFPRVSSAF